MSELTGESFETRNKGEDEHSCICDISHPVTYLVVSSQACHDSCAYICLSYNRANILALEAQFYLYLRLLTQSCINRSIGQLKYKLA